MKRIVTIGGGTGTFVVLSALRTIPGLALSAIVSSADDGGSTGRLRDAYGFLPVGDARQALVALSEDDRRMRDLFAYRFAKGDVSGHNLGNLFLTALTDLLGSESAALEEASRLLRVRGTVLPASLQAATLVAHLEDGTSLVGEHRLDEHDPSRAPIAKLELTEPVDALPAALEAIRDADILILGPGDLYASSIAPLLPRGMREAFAKSRGRFIYLANLFSKSGQTGGMTAREHIAELARYAGREPDTILMHHNGGYEEEVLAGYRQEGEEPLQDDFDDDARVHRTPLASVYAVPAVPGDPVPRSLVRHNVEKLAALFQKLIP